MLLLAKVYKHLFESYQKSRINELRSQFKLDSSVDLNYPENIILHGDISIGKHTYINGARIVSGRNHKVVIGEWCAIGHNVNIIGRTHDSKYATGAPDKRPTIHKDIIIGDHVWIGTNVFIREGIRIGNGCVIGANSVVTKSFPENSIIAGCPAKLIGSL